MSPGIVERGARQRIDEEILPEKNRMLSHAQRTTILELHAQGVSKREIARVLEISRVARRLTF